MKIIHIDELIANPKLLVECANNNDSAILAHKGEAQSVVLPLTPTLLQQGTSLNLAIHFFEAGVITLSSAAKMAELPIEIFLTRLSELGIIVVDQSEQELEDDLKVLSNE